jgi:hypothetical protein
MATPTARRRALGLSDRSFPMQALSEFAAFFL